MLTLHIFTFTEDHTVLFTEAKGDHKNFFNAVPPRGGYPHSKEQRRQKRWKLSMYYTQKDLGSIFSLNKKKVRRLVSGSTCKSPLHLDNYKADQSANQLFLDPPTRRTQGTPLPSRCRDTKYREAQFTTADLGAKTTVRTKWQVGKSEL